MKPTKRYKPAFCEARPRAGGHNVVHGQHAGELDGGGWGDEVSSTRANRAQKRRTRRAQKRWNRYLDAVGKELGALAMRVLNGDATPVQRNRYENITRTLDRLEWASHTWALYTWEWWMLRADAVVEDLRALADMSRGDQTGEVDNVERA